MFGIEGRYAHALFSAASKKECLEKVEGELNGFKVGGWVGWKLICGYVVNACGCGPTVSPELKAKL